MAISNRPAGGQARFVLSLLAMAALVQLAPAHDLLREWTQPLVLACLKFAAIPAVSTGNEIVIGHLRVAWTRDCAGLNVMAALLAVVLWTDRAEPFSLRSAWRLVSAIPAGILINVARALSIIGYRYFAYPSVESASLHFFVGFVWLIPAVAFFVPKFCWRANPVAVEMLHAAAVLALLISTAQSPRGDWVLVCALVCLAHWRRQPLTASTLVLTVVWLGAAAFIALWHMESLWLPWLLASPAYQRRAFLLNPGGVVALAGTVPVFAMHAAAPIGIATALILLAWSGWRERRQPTSMRPAIPLNWGVPRIIPLAALAACALLPFISALVVSPSKAGWRPPAEWVKHEIPTGGFELRFPGQPEDVTLVWFESKGAGRHHTLQACLSFSGVETKPSANCPEVLTDGSRWLREFFLQDDLLVLSYGSYLRRTFWPMSDPGVHLVAVADSAAMDERTFSSRSESLVTCVHQALKTSSSRSVPSKLTALTKPRDTKEAQ